MMKEEVYLDNKVSFFSSLLFHLNTRHPGHSNLYFIPMFTKFLAYKNLYHNFGQVYLNEKLFCKDKVHFTATGTSVLAKTLIAVANNPRY
jgi:lysophospholipase L1-like esterase